MEEEPMQETNTAQETRRLIPVSRFNQFHPDPSVAALRWLIFSDKDGFRRCVVRRGRRVLIDEQEYFRWLNEINERSRARYTFRKRRQ